METGLNIRKAETLEDYQLAKTLFQEYADSLYYTLDTKGFQEEVASLPGNYAPPGGFILLAFLGEEPAGCVALERLEKNICEMKRMYVRPGYRKKGVGRSLAERSLEEARKMGYKKMWLDMVESMKNALGLYQSLGFVKIKPFRNVKLAGAVFLELDLE